MAEFEDPQTIDIVSFLEKEGHPQARSFLLKTYSFSEQDLEDVIQDSTFALFKNIKEGKLVTLTCKLTTYFIQICVNQALSKKRKNQKNAQFTEAVEMTQKDEYSSEKIDELLDMGDDGITAEQKQMMRDIVQDLPKPCEDILWLYYGDNLDMATIAKMLDYSSPDSVKTTKSRCMSKLKARFMKIKEDFYD